MLLLVLIVNTGFAEDCNLNQKHTELIGQLHTAASNPDIDELSRWKRWEALLLACRQALNTNHTERALSDFLFLGYVGFATNSAATREYMISEVHPAFIKAPSMFLKVIAEQPVLLESSCYYLGRYFTFENNNTSTKQEFLSQHANRFFANLTLNQAKHCIRQF